jgi:uncharacterized protein (DUF1330 family)
MAVYCIADLEVTDPQGIEEYRKAVPATIAKYGGKYLARGGACSKLEGHWEPKRLVILEFPSLEHAKRWYDSEDYRALKALRMKTAKTNLVLIEGVPGA